MEGGNWTEAQARLSQQGRLHTSLLIQTVNCSCSRTGLPFALCCLRHGGSAGGARRKAVMIQSKVEWGHRSAKSELWEAGVWQRGREPCQPPGMVPLVSQVPCWVAQGFIQPTQCAPRHMDSCLVSKQGSSRLRRGVSWPQASQQGELTAVPLSPVSPPGQDTGKAQLWSTRRAAHLPEPRAML